MALARPAVSPQGQLLAPRGTRLTPRHIRLFKMWGVTDADIEGHMAPPELSAPPLSEAERQTIEQAVARRFEGVLDHPAMEEIARAAAHVALARGSEAND